MHGHKRFWMILVRKTLPEPHLRCGGESTADAGDASLGSATSGALVTVTVEAWFRPATTPVATS
jgi:hypothetical protein